MIHHPASIIPSGFASRALQLLQKVQHGTSSVELVYMTHEHWPLRPGHTAHTRPTVRISVLDSSFNPPTLAHLALANSSPPLSPQHSSTITASTESYDAQILLLSVRNADKVLKPGDATFVQRLEMMRLLAHDVRITDIVESGSGASQTCDNVAVAIIDEPTFVGKSTVLIRFLQTRLARVIESQDSQRISDKRGPSYPIPSPKLTFLLGFDTLIRLFSPKYYPSEQVMIQMLRTFLSPDQDDCRMVCAFRENASINKEAHDKTLEVAREFITGDRIAFIDIGTVEQTYSSSEVRTKVAAGDRKWKQLVTEAISNYVAERGIYSHSYSKTKPF